MDISIKKEDLLTNKFFSENEAILNKEISLNTKDGKFIEGVIREKNSDVFILSENGNWDRKTPININNVKDIEISKHPYFSLEHYRDLRIEKKPRPEFRFSKEDLEKLVGKYAILNYDGKIIDGKIVRIEYRRDCISEKNKHNSIFIKSIKDRELKEIKDYRIREIEITGENLDSHLAFQSLRVIESNIYVKIDNMSIPLYVDLDLTFTDTDPSQLLEDYFEEKMDGIKGSEFIGDKFKHSWTQEVLRKYSHGDSKINLEKDIKSAREVNEYYERKLELIDDIFEEMTKVDWTRFGKKQSDGEIYALEYIYNSGILFN